MYKPRRKDKVIKADFYRGAAIVEAEKASADAVKAFKHKPYCMKDTEVKKNDN